MTTPDIPEDIRVAAKEAFLRARLISILDDQIDIIALALLSERNRAREEERERWKPAATYFDRYCQDEAEDDAVEWVGCSEQQHLDAKAFAEIVGWKPS